MVVRDSDLLVGRKKQHGKVLEFYCHSLPLKHWLCTLNYTSRVKFCSSFRLKLRVSQQTTWRIKPMLKKDLARPSCHIYIVFFSLDFTSPLCSFLLKL